MQRFKLECGHDLFHRKCLFNWLKTKRQCPVCRKATNLAPNSNPIAFHIAQNEDNMSSDHSYSDYRMGMYDSDLPYDEDEFMYDSASMEPEQYNMV
jgi:hypothetical protein